MIKGPEGPDFGPKPGNRDDGKTESGMPEGIPEEELYPEKIELKPDQEQALNELVHKVLEENKKPE